VEQIEPGGDPGVVARVDSTEVFAAELYAFVEQMPAGLRSPNPGEEARMSYLRSLLAKHLLELEAREQGLDISSEVQADLMARWREHILKAYRNEVLASQVQVSDADIRAYFTQKGLDRRRQVAGILVDEEALAQEIHARLIAGEDFAELAEQYTIDERSATRGGLLGFIDLERAQRLRIPAAIFRELETGQFSAVLSMGKRYQIVRFFEDQSVPFAERRQQIHDLLYERELVAAEQREIRNLERKLRLKLVPEGVKLLQDKAELYTRVRRSHLSAEESVQPLFTYRGGAVTLGDYVDILGRDIRSLSGWGVQDGEEVVAAAGELVLGKWLIFEAARRAAITDGRDQQRWLEANRKELMIKKLRQLEIIDKVQPDREDARDFYEDNEELFQTSGEYILVEVMVETETEAAELRQRIARGEETLASLTEQYPLKAEMRDEVGMTHMGDYERLTRPQLYKAVQEAEVNAIVGPVEVDGGFSLFKVLDREEGQVQPFSEVESKARAFLRGQQREQRFEEWIDSLMDKYEDRISISQRALAVALPDTFLRRLEREGQE
jgi:parvulin-like peptidyl-prolyl isomerase